MNGRAAAVIGAATGVREIIADPLPPAGAHGARHSLHRRVRPLTFATAVISDSVRLGGCPATAKGDKRPPAPYLSPS